MEQYEIEGQRFLQRLEDQFLGIGNYDPLRELWDTGEDFWDDPDWWEDPDPSIQSLPSSRVEEEAIAAGTAQQVGMSDIGVPGALVAESVGDTMGDIKRWFDIYQNGQIPQDALKFVEGFGYVRPDVGFALQAMKKAAAKDGVPLSGGGYRSYEEQASLWNGGENHLAAPPGKSNHGWGIAVDFSGADWNTQVYKWLVNNARRFGFAHPDWAQQDGSKPEPWHWEYVGGAEVKGIYKNRSVKRNARTMSRTMSSNLDRSPQGSDLVSPMHPLTGGNGFVAAALALGTEELQNPRTRRSVKQSLFFDSKPKTRAEIIATAKKMAAAWGWTGKQWKALRWIVEGHNGVPGESNWNPEALNPDSGATGIPQLNPNSHEIPKNWKNPVVQINWMLNYIAGRYGNPLAAWEHKVSTSTHWY